MNVYEYMNVAAPIIYDLVLLASFTTRIQLKDEREVCFFIVFMGPGPRSSWFFDLSVKLYDNDDAKGVNLLQRKFHSFHILATIVSYLTKALTGPYLVDERPKYERLIERRAMMDSKTLKNNISPGNSFHRYCGIVDPRYIVSYCLKTWFYLSCLFL